MAEDPRAEDDSHDDDVRDDVDDTHVDDTHVDDNGQPVEHDPTGLDLARRIAGQVNASEVVRPRPRRQRRSNTATPLSSGARPDERDPQLVGNVLDRLVRERGWQTELDVHALMARWPELIGPENAQHCRAESYQDGVLTIRTSSTAWAVQMRSIAPAVVARVASHLGDGVVTRVVVKGPDAPSWSHGRLRVKGRGPRDTYG